MTTSKKYRYHGVKNGYRSGLEERIAQFFEGRGIKAGYETIKIKYEKPIKATSYTPDFVLSNGVIIETKGRFIAADRQKHLLIREQHPELDIRFLFQSSKVRLNKTSKTTYADWCNKHSFSFADKDIPEAWLVGA